MNNLLPSSKKLFAVVLSVALLPLPSPASIIAPKAPAPVTLSAAAAPAAQPAGFAPSALHALSNPSIALQPLLQPMPAPLISPAVSVVAANASLQTLVTRVAAAKPGSTEAALALTETYAGARSAAAASDEPVGRETATRPLKPVSLVSAPRSKTAPAAWRSQSGKANIGLIAGIGAAVVVVGIVISVLMHRGSAKNKMWEQSKARADVIQIENARRAGDAETLFKIEASARARQKAGEPDASKAKAHDAFDGLAAMRAGLNGNAVSQKPEIRPGGQLLSSWETRLEAEASGARKSGNIVNLSRALSDLGAEIKKEGVAITGFNGDLSKFKGEVPAFGGALGEQGGKAFAELTEFGNEVGAENRLHEKYNGVMRSIVADRLAATDPDFRGALARQTRLADIAAGPIVSLNTVAENIDRDFKTMAAERREQRDNLAAADTHTADPVIGADGKPEVDKDGKAKTQDNSQSWRDKAGKNATAAQVAAASAKSNLEAFNRDLATLRADRNIRQERLENALPGSAQVGRPDWAHGVTRDLLDPWALGNSASSFTEADANDARVRFAQAKQSITGVQRSIEERSIETRQRVQKTVDDEIARQVKGW